MRVWCDIDDTLIDWSTKGSGLAVEWKPNPHVVDYVASLYRQGFKVSFWSLSGADYAHNMVKEVYMRLDREAPDHEILAKFPYVPRDGDIFIDDDPLPTYRHRNIHPSVITIIGKHQGELNV